MPIGKNINWNNLFLKIQIIDADNNTSILIDNTKKIEMLIIEINDSELEEHLIH